MAAVTDSKQIISDLSDLIKLDYDAIAAYQSANEEVTNTKYEEAVETSYAEPIQAILRQGLADERRHKDWIVATLERVRGI